MKNLKHPLPTSELRQNDQASVQLLSDPDGVPAIRLFAPVKGRGLVVTTCQQLNEPDMYALLTAVFVTMRGRVVAIPKIHWPDLVSKGLLITGDQITAAVPYACDLSQPQRFLMPTRSPTAPAGPAVTEGAIVNPGLTLGVAGADWPFVGPHAPAGGLLWVPATATGLTLPYLTGRFAPALKDALVPGGPAPDLGDPVLRDALFAADILIVPADVAAREAAWQERLMAAQAQYRREGYVLLSGLLPPLQLAAMRAYYRNCIAEGHLEWGDAQLERRYRLINDRLGRYLQRQFTTMISFIAGGLVTPTFTYIMGYRPGAVLKPHRDQARCVHSITLQLDYEPEPQGATPWPLGLTDRQGEVVWQNMALGDALFYRGQELEHFREVLPAGHRATSLTLHYVPAHAPAPR